MKCSKCGFETNNVFCGNCGNQILPNKDVRTDSTYVDINSFSYERQDENNPKMKACKTCGKFIAKKAKRCPYCGVKNKKKFYKKKSFWVFAVLFILLASYLFANSDLFYIFSSKESVASLTPRNLSYAAWLDLDNSARSDLIFESITEKYNGKYVSVDYCVITHVGTEHIVVRDMNDPQTIHMYISKEQQDELSSYDEGDIVEVVGRVKAVDSFSGRKFELRDARIVNQHYLPIYY